MSNTGVPTLACMMPPPPPSPGGATVYTQCYVLASAFSSVLFNPQIQCLVNPLDCVLYSMLVDCTHPFLFFVLFLNVIYGFVIPLDVQIVKQRHETNFFFFFLFLKAEMWSCEMGLVFYFAYQHTKSSPGFTSSHKKKVSCVLGTYSTYIL